MDGWTPQARPTDPVASLENFKRPLKPTWAKTTQDTRVLPGKPCVGRIFSHGQLILRFGARAGSRNQNHTNVPAASTNPRGHEAKNPVDKERDESLSNRPVQTTENRDAEK